MTNATSSQLVLVQTAIAEVLAWRTANRFTPHFKGKAHLPWFRAFGKQYMRLRKTAWWELGDEGDEGYVLFIDGSVGCYPPPLGPFSIHWGSDSSFYRQYMAPRYVNLEECSDSELALIHIFVDELAAIR